MRLLRRTSPSLTAERVDGVFAESSRRWWLYFCASALPGYQSSHSWPLRTRRTITSWRGSGRSMIGPRSVRISPVVRFMT